MRNRETTNARVNLDCDALAARQLKVYAALRRIARLLARHTVLHPVPPDETRTSEVPEGRPD